MTTEVRDGSENWWGARSVWGGAGKRVDGVFPGRPYSFRHQRRPVDDCSPGRGGMPRNISWRNGFLQRKPGLDYGMQSYARM